MPQNQLIPVLIFRLLTTWTSAYLGFCEYEIILNAPTKEQETTKNEICILVRLLSFFLHLTTVFQGFKIRGKQVIKVRMKALLLWACVWIQNVCPFVWAWVRPTGQIWDTQPSVAKLQKTKTRAATDLLKNISICDRLPALNYALRSPPYFIIVIHIHSQCSCGCGQDRLLWGPRFTHM